MTENMLWLLYILSNCIFVSSLLSYTVVIYPMDGICHIHVYIHSDLFAPFSEIKTDELKLVSNIYIINIRIHKGGGSFIDITFLLEGRFNEK